MGLRKLALDSTKDSDSEKDSQQTYRLTQLDGGRSRGRSFTAGFILQVLMVLLLVRLAAYSPKFTLLMPRQSVELITPSDLITERPKAVHLIAPKLPKEVQRQEPTPQLQPELQTPPMVAKIEPPRVEPPKPVPVEKPVEIAKNFPSVATPAPAPEPPKPAVKTNVFGSAPQTATVQAPVQKVQTGGFGDANGFRGETKEEAKLNAPKVGGFGSPVGPGNGNGTAGAKGTPGVVASAGFGSGVAAVGTGNGMMPGGGVRSGGFGDAHAGVGSGPVAKNTPAALVPVEVLEKPQPIYTQEARNLKIQGEVHLKVVFQADGHVQVLQVVRGLGHGLDEAASAAARKIRFKPAQREGQPCDMTATVHIVFQLAS